MKSLSILKPPSAHIYVVEPSNLRIKISGDSWYLERNRDYYISLVLTDTDDNVMYIPEVIFCFNLFFTFQRWFLFQSPASFFFCRMQNS